MLNEIKINDLIRYQFCMNTINHYSKVAKITNSYIILENNFKFNKNTGWGIGQHKRYSIEGVNDHNTQINNDHANAYYF